MKTITARNPHEALIKGMHELKQFGVQRNSRNGPVLMMPTPVTTVYERPEERVIFWKERDANPFFHLYESLWMLAGRETVQPLLRYVKKMADYADNGIIHGAYGRRWRYSFNVDQLRVIISRLQADPNDRRSVIQMWDARMDLGKSFKDLPCNTMASVQINTEGALDITVFCRSNDIIWGAYGANAVQFSTLLEYLACQIGVPIGRYYQVSVNWHAYRDIFDKMLEALTVGNIEVYAQNGEGIQNPYKDFIMPTLMPVKMYNVDGAIRRLLEIVDGGFQEDLRDNATTWEYIIYTTLKAHHIHKTEGPEAAIKSLEGLMNGKAPHYDWTVAATEWLERRVK